MKKAVYALLNTLLCAIAENLYLFHVNCRSPVVIQKVDSSAVSPLVDNLITLDAAEFYIFCTYILSSRSAAPGPNWLKFGVNIVKNVSVNSDYSFH